MSLGHWLNSLTFIDHVIILLFFGLSCFLSWVTLTSMQTWYSKNQGSDRYAKQFRITPFAFLGIAIFYTFIIYRLIGPLLTNLANSALG